MRTRLRLLGIVFVALGYVTAVACADQAEGERCDPNSNDDDCAGDLKCTKLSALTGTTSGAAVCCPRPGIPATADICLQQSASIPDGGATTPDSGSGTGGASSSGGAPATDAGAGGADPASSGGASSGGTSADASLD